MGWGGAAPPSAGAQAEFHRPSTPAHGQGSGRDSALPLGQGWKPVRAADPAAPLPSSPGSGSGPAALRSPSKPQPTCLGLRGLVPVAAAGMSRAGVAMAAGPQSRGQMTPHPLELPPLQDTVHTPGAQLCVWGGEEESSYPPPVSIVDQDLRILSRPQLASLTASLGLGQMTSSMQEIRASIYVCPPSEHLPSRKPP